MKKNEYYFTCQSQNLASVENYLTNILNIKDAKILRIFNGYAVFETAQNLDLSGIKKVKK